MKLPKERGLIKSLTGVRAIAAYMVFFYHYNIIAAKYPNSILALLIDEMHIGVPIFFVLSGFLITYRYYDKRHEFFRKEFYIKRFARIYPLYFILLTATYFYHYISQQNPENISLPNYLLNLTLLSGFFNDLKFSGIPQAWSLTVEELFYILSPIIFLFLRRKLSNIIFLIIAFITIGFILIGISQWLQFGSFFESSEFMLTYTFFGRCMEFMTGILLAIYYLKHQKNATSPKRTSFTFLGSLGIVLCMIGLAYFPEDGASHYLYLRFVIFSIILPIIGIAPLFFGLATETTILSKVLSSPLLMLLGKASYAFYLIHLGFIASLSEEWTGNFILLFLLLNLIAVVLYYFIERPLNTYIKSSFLS